MENEPNLHIVVGDCYGNFAKNRHVLTWSEAYVGLGREAVTPGVYVLGQGISTADKAALLARVEFNGGTVASGDADKASLALTHKRRHDNVLITSPRKEGQGTYVFELALNDDMDRLSDHVTGQHVGGMIAMEAGRQATIAALESEFPLARCEQPWGLVLDSFTIQFKNYLFPLPAELRLHVGVRDRQSDQIDVTLEIDVLQGGVLACAMVLEVRMFRDEVLNKIETRRAEKAISAVHARYATAARERSLV